MIAVRVSSDLPQLQKALAQQQLKIQRAVAQGLNEGGDLVRTRVRAAMREQTGLTKLSSVTKRERGVRAFAIGRGAIGGVGPARPARLAYWIIYTGKPTKPDEFRKSVKTGPGGGVTVWLWNVAHKFKRSFRGAGKIAGLLKMRTTGPRVPMRGFDGPNLAKEAVKGGVASTFLAQSAALVPPVIEKRLSRAL